MKTFISILSALLLLCGTGSSSFQALASGEQPATGSGLTISGTTGLSGLLTHWADAYNQSNAGNPVSVTTIQSLASLAGSDINFLTEKELQQTEGSTAWKMVVGRDAVVGVVNHANPLYETIMKQGISQLALTGLFGQTGNTTWGALLGATRDNKVHIYISGSESVKAGLAAYLGLPVSSLEGVSVVSSEDFSRLMAADPDAIGFCNLIQVYDPGSNGLSSGLSFLPIDKNGNGRLDYSENIYQDVVSFMRGLWIGKYPRILCENLYACSVTAPGSATGSAFMKWVLTEGQQYLGSEGYLELVATDRQQKLESLNAEAAVVPGQSRNAFSKNALFLILGGLVLAYLLTLLVVSRTRRLRTTTEMTGGVSGILREDGIQAPAGLYFDKSHTWAFMEKNGLVRVGVDDFLQHITGTLTRIRMKNPGEKVKKGDVILSLVRDGKQLNIKSPVTGLIREMNTMLIEEASLVNKSPYDQGWVYMIEPADWVKDAELLVMIDRYRCWIKNEFSRMKDFLAVTMQAKSPAFDQLVLQDGGALCDHVLADLEPKVWEDFQTFFLDNPR
ncbi:MAG TPA: hypothetical protein P5531_01375 [Bacteroidales bacterium]|nr:hypothetical protein [Bacteroidales bacterium]HSA42305.1 hypothetical protein [Bacteroidales bacterium]